MAGTAGTPEGGTPPDGGMSRQLLTDERAQDGFSKARDKINEKVATEEKHDQIKADAAQEGEIRGEEMADAFDFDTMMKELDAEAEKFESELDSAKKYEQIRKEGLTDEQKTKLDEIKERVSKRTAEQEKNVAGEGAETTPKETTGTETTPPASAGAAQSAEAETTTPAEGGQPATGEPAKPAEGEPAKAPEGDQQPAITQEAIAKQVTEAVEKGLEPIKNKLAEKEQENADLKDKLKRAEEVRDEIKEDRDNLKKKTNFHKFSSAAHDAGIPTNLHEFAQQKAQEIVNEAGKEMSFADIFEKLKEDVPEFFAKVKDDKELEVKPGATGTGGEGGGSAKAPPAEPREKAASFREAKQNLRKRVQGMT